MKDSFQISNFKLKTFINGFNFPSPSWENLPEGFPNLDKDGLTVQEGHLLDAIRLAYFANEGGWKVSLKRNSKIGLIGLICLIGLVGLISLISPNKSVNAATGQIESIIQSTMSAI